MFSFTTSSQLTTYTQQRVSKRDDEMSSSFSSSSDANETHNNTTTKKVYRHVDVVSFADLCLEADVILESSLNSNSGAASAHFHQNHFPEKIKKIKKESVAIKKESAAINDALIKLWDRLELQKLKDLKLCLSG